MRAVCLLSLLLLPTTLSFQISSVPVRAQVKRRAEEPRNDIDWDEEFAKVARGEVKGVKEPSQLERRAMKASRDVQRASNQFVQETKYRARRSNLLNRDTNFYLSALAVLAFLPVIFVVLTSSFSPGGGGGGEYIV